jgi:hypothetical protein
MFINKLIIGIFCLVFLNGCAQNFAFLGPAVTLANTGSVYQAGLSYGSDRIITSLTGKSTGQNIKEILQPKKSDTNFQKLVKREIEDTRKKLHFTNQ